MLYSWLHLLALIVYLGAVIGLGWVLLPSVSALERRGDKLRLLSRGLKIYNPLQVGALGVLIFTGAFQLTDLKAVYREAFLNEIGLSLGIKLIFVFLLVIVSVYQSLGIGHRLVKRQEAGEDVNTAELDSVIRRLTTMSWSMLILAATVLWFGVRLRF